jgi:predicted negative regulator of RcsB-dependent stress response
LSTKLSKEDVKSPDQVLKTLNQGFQWSQNHSKALLAGIVAFIAIGAGYTVFSNLSEKKESQAQETYAKFEKDYLEKKRGFDEADRQALKPPAKDSKEPVKVKATGDMEKDYGPEVAGMKKTVEEYPSSKAAQMAALSLSEIYMNYKKFDDAQQALQKVENNSQGKDLISSIVLTQLGNVYSEKNDCKAAVDQWQKVLSHSNVQFLHDTLRLKTAFCYEKMNDTAKAEELYKKISQNSQDPKNPQAGETGLGKEAEKYLRLLKLKKEAPQG